MAVSKPKHNEPIDVAVKKADANDKGSFPVPKGNEMRQSGPQRKPKMKSHKRKGA